jgi:hypothetical protein
MKNDEHPDFNLDELLKQTLKDDLPPQAQARMKQRLARFRQQVEGRRRDDSRLSLGSRRYAVVFARAALVAAGLLLIVLGLSIRGLSRQNILVESFNAYQKEAAVFAGISDAGYLECRVRISRGAEPPREFLIEWLTPDCS